ncbi:MAG TPA: double-strand break repair helicase AddA [Devosia sp.]|nr:double-strand break repair helicase AddA [Devosia sp.]
MRRLLDPLPDSVTHPQRRASNPLSSVWVRANAGSGKTHVLTERVMRLLLAGVRPEEILCLTYTKAAAAEMRRRVSARLAEWSLLPAGELAAALEKLEGRAPSKAELARARTLFAHALETPGGLKINTIHAFCESVLHRFPLEAGVPFDFSVIEEAEAEDMIARTREAVLAEGLRGASPIAAAVDTLFDLMSDDSIGTAIETALARGPDLRLVLANPLAAKARLRAYAGVAPGETLATAEGAITAGSMLHPGDLRQAAEIGSKPFAKKLTGDLAHPTADMLIEAFLTTEGEPRQKLLNNGEAAAHPDLLARLLAEQQRLLAACTHRKAVELAVRSEALLDILAEIARRYEAEKRARSRLDFDDLVERLGDLFAGGVAADWVRYKLDAGISHILVDESQDTNPAQWRVVREIAGEFFSGESAAQRPRSLFLVGDEKQSIYSFQGADPALFGGVAGDLLERAHEAAMAFEKVPLRTSFRTLPGVLTAVDRVFADERLRAAVLADADGVLHETARAEAGGTVTLWPPMRPEAQAPVDGWPLAPRETAKSPARRLAEAIAGRIANWLETARPLGPRGRPVRPDDMLILVQKRSELFHELIRALGRRGIPTPGADRLGVTGHIAVLDLLALGDVLVNPADDLQLAALLRSPLFDVSEDDLMAVATARPLGQTLWRALEGTDLPTAREAFARLSAWRSRLDFGRLFEFYAEVLYREGGLRRLHARLGGEVDDVVAEFLSLALAHEQAAQPSLIGFLAAMRARDVSIRRELAEAGAGVRVMTVHGAKGLEAPIVILADAATHAGAGKGVPVHVLDIEPGPFLLHAANDAQHIDASRRLSEAAAEAENNEYWRRLYVGMTRAEDELYITGYLTQKGSLDGTWFDVVHRTLWHGAPEARLDADGVPIEFTFPSLSDAGPASAAAAAPLPAIEPLRLSPLPRPAPMVVVTPSTAAEAASPERVFDSTAESAIGAESARRAGIALHALLQHLGRVPGPDRPRVADKALAALLPEAPERHAELARKALSVLGNPAFADLFGPNSRAELPFMMEALRDGKPVRLAGRIDRLVVAKDSVLVVDYKSDANPPGDVSEVPASYRMQVGLYAFVASQLFPGLAVEAGILWTSLESMMILPQAMLGDTVKAFTRR